MRQLIIDTETTGLDPRQDHRVIEIAALELVDRRPTGRHLHLKINPEREIDVGASEVHGMTWDDLRDKPPFRDVAHEFIAFARGAEWVIHNAPFDLGFLDAELARIEGPPCKDLAASVVDTLNLARELFPGKRNNLDALCERFAVDNAGRTLHGALLDAQLLAEVYLALTRGQESLVMDLPKGPAPGEGRADLPGIGPRPAVLVVAPTAAELDAHRAYLEALDAASRGRCVWLALEREVGLAA
jgi:DNA polymerase-3 subunit epsilon